jgi:hypothetical protein
MLMAIHCTISDMFALKLVGMMDLRLNNVPAKRGEKAYPIDIFASVPAAGATVDVPSALAQVLSLEQVLPPTVIVMVSALFKDAVEFRMACCVSV